MNEAIKPKIVHLDTRRELRGGQRQLLLLARGLRERGHEQLVVCPEGSALEKHARQNGFRVFDLPAHDPFHGHGILQLRQQLLAEPCQILHAHDGRGQTLAWLASVRMPVRRVASRRVTFLPGRTWIHRVKYQYTCDGIIAVSEYVRQLLVNSGVPDSMIEVIPDGIDLPRDIPDAVTRRRVRARRGFSEEEFVLGHVGAFTPEKGQDIAIQAMILLEGSLPQARLLLVGRGPMRESPEFQAAIRKVRGRVHLLDYVDDLSELFAALDLFIMPSRSEGLGSSALLAIAHGLAVVATRVGGLPEIVKGGETGWLIPPDSPSALADVIVAAAADRKNLSRLCANAREQARLYSADIMVARTEAFYARLLG